MMSRSKGRGRPTKKSKRNISGLKNQPSSASSERTSSSSSAAASLILRPFLILYRSQNHLYSHKNLRNLVKIFRRRQMSWEKLRKVIFGRISMTWFRIWHYLSPKKVRSRASRLAAFDCPQLYLAPERCQAALGCFQSCHFSFANGFVVALQCFWFSFSLESEYYFSKSCIDILCTSTGWGYC